jgi:predicted NUDIX family phosphoesterase
VKDYGDEQVWVVPRAVCFGDGEAPHGFVPDAAGPLLERAREHGTYVPRASAETDASLQQIIPYVVVIQDDTLLLLQRTTKQTEARLHNLYSIGVGGHINPGDETNADRAGQHPFMGGLARELDEELTTSGEFAEVNVLGLINDDTNDVGSVHLGVAVEAVADGIEVAIRETEAMTGRFVTLAEALELRDGMESWSQYLLDAMRSGVGRLSARQDSTA